MTDRSTSVGPPHSSSTSTSTSTTTMQLPIILLLLTLLSFLTPSTSSSLSNPSAARRKRKLRRSPGVKSFTMQQKDGANGWDPATRSKWNGAKSNVVSSPKSTTEQGKSTDFLSETQQKLEREGERIERMEAAGNVMTKDFDDAQSNVVSSSKSTTKQGKNTDSLSEMQQELKREGERSERMGGGWEHDDEGGW